MHYINSINSIENVANLLAPVGFGLKNVVKYIENIHYIKFKMLHVK